jgi:hypothetical protein
MHGDPSIPRKVVQIKLNHRNLIALCFLVFYVERSPRLSNEEKGKTREKVRWGF